MLLVRLVVRSVVPANTLGLHNSLGQTIKEAIIVSLYKPVMFNSSALHAVKRRETHLDLAILSPSRSYSLNAELRKGMPLPLQHAFVVAEERCNCASWVAALATCPVVTVPPRLPQLVVSSACSHAGQFTGGQSRNAPKDACQRLEHVFGARNVVCSAVRQVSSPAFKFA